MPTREQMHSLTQGIISSYDARAGAVRRIRKDTHAQLGRLGRARAAMARQQHATLTSGRADLARDVRIRLTDTHAAHQTMARQQQATLTSGRADLARDVRTRLTDTHAAHQAMARQQRSIRARGHSELRRHGAALLSRLGSERQGAHNEWQRMATTLSKRRGGATSVAARPGPTAPAPASPAEAAEEESDEEIVAPAKVGEIIEEPSTLSERVLEYLATHPDGAHLRQLEQHFGVMRLLQMARIVKRLMDDGKARKDGLRYFAIPSPVS